MSGRAFTIWVYVVIASAGGVLQLLAWDGRAAVPTLGALLSRLMRTRAGRVRPGRLGVAGHALLRAVS